MWTNWRRRRSIQRSRRYESQWMWNRWIEEQLLPVMEQQAKLVARLIPSLNPTMHPTNFDAALAKWRFSSKHLEMHMRRVTPLRTPANIVSEVLPFRKRSQNTCVRIARKFQLPKGKSYWTKTKSRRISIARSEHPQFEHRNFDALVYLILFTNRVHQHNWIDWSRCRRKIILRSKASDTLRGS